MKLRALLDPVDRQVAQFDIETGSKPGLADSWPRLDSPGTPSARFTRPCQAAWTSLAASFSSAASPIRSSSIAGTMTTSAKGMARERRVM